MKQFPILCFFILLALINSNLLNANNKRTLIMVQVIFRHGERAPILTYPNDPYKNYNWGTPLGTLTKHGIQQHIELGKELRKRYMFKFKLLSKTYNLSEVNSSFFYIIT